MREWWTKVRMDRHDFVKLSKTLLREKTGEQIWNREKFIDNTEKLCQHIEYLEDIVRNFVKVVKPKPAKDDF